MPKAVLGTGAVVVNENATILKNFNVEMGTETQSVTVQSKKEQEGRSSFTNLEALEALAHTTPIFSSEM